MDGAEVEEHDNSAYVILDLPGLVVSILVVWVGEMFTRRARALFRGRVVERRSNSKFDDLGLASSRSAKSFW